MDLEASNVTVDVTEIDESSAGLQNFNQYNIVKLFIVLADLRGPPGQGHPHVTTSQPIRRFEQ